MTRTTLACLVLLAVPMAAAHADGLYRYVDPSGRVVYSDQPPPPSVKDVQSKRLQENVIETDPVPFAARDAAARNPVTLYTFDCEVCKQAESLLAKRGVPFASVIVSEQAGAAKLQALTGKMSAPVLQVGDKPPVTGFNPDVWQKMLDDAGYPRSAPQRTIARAAPKSPDAAANPQPEPEAPPTPRIPGSDYPK
jgi:glutaredoxin